MNRLDEILTYKALAFKHGSDQSALMDLVVAQNQDNPALQTVTKNVCAHLSIQLVDRLEGALGVLDMSKRQFIETAIIDALDRFDTIAHEYDIFQRYEVEAAIDRASAGENA
jgi:hypothetical protein